MDRTSSKNVWPLYKSLMVCEICNILNPIYESGHDITLVVSSYGIGNMILTLFMGVGLQWPQILTLYAYVDLKLYQGAKARMLGRQNVRNFCCETLALNSIFGLCFMPVYLIKSNCYSLIYSLAVPIHHRDKDVTTEMVNLK